jgi:Trk K+ transport system NAD-binding subunit
MPAQPRRADRRGGHLIVCGDGPLSYRITEELTSRYGEHVTVILPDRRNHHGPQISALPRVRVLEYPELSSQAFTDADVQSARALAVVWQDDVGNLHAGLRAQELNPGLRLVLAIFNGRLGDHIRMLFPDCTVLSGTAMSAPSFVAAALDQPAPSHVRVQRRTLYVARPHDVAPGAVVCGLTDDHDDPRLLPPGEALRDQAGLVLAVADGTPRNPLARSPNPARALAGLLRRLVWHKFGLVFTALLAVIGIGLALLATVYSLSDAFYLTLMDLTGSALTRSQDTAAEKVAQLRLTDDGLAERLEKTTGNTISRSVPYLAAPAFATAMLEHQVLRTIDVGRHVLLIAEIRVADQAGLAGSRISDTEQDGQARVLALQASGVAVLDWSPQRGYLLAAGDRLIVLATRRGLGRFLSVH